MTSCTSYILLGEEFIGREQWIVGVLWLSLAILLAGIIIFFRVKKLKVKQEELQKVETEERLPKFKFDD